MNELLRIGFEPSGHWYLEHDQLRLHMKRNGSQKNVLYAIIADGEVMYVGKTTKTLASRMYGYQNPSESQRTNVRNNALIKDLLKSQTTVELFALPDHGLLHYGGFHLNLAAGLEDSVISVLRPAWNTMPKSKLAIEVAESSEPFQRFWVTLHATYWDKGFFNVPVEYSEEFGADGETIEIETFNNGTPILGTINRYSNNNATPRIMGGAALRDWFQQNCQVQEKIAVQVASPYAIRISR